MLTGFLGFCLIIIAFGLWAAFWSCFVLYLEKKKEEKPTHKYPKRKVK